MRQAFAGVLLIFCVSTALIAQNGKPSFSAAADSDQGESGESRILYWNNQKSHSVGYVEVNYGRPIWKKAYDDTAAFDLATKGRVWRLGSNYWAMLDTDMPLRIAGKEI